MTARIRERIGADAARVWARELRLGNPYAKAILLAVANYMNEDGSAWPGLATLSRDTDITQDTIIRRLRWLTDIGAIAMFKTWIDENGRRNHDGRGRPTSTEIRFLFDVDAAVIEAAAADGAEDKPLRGAALAASQHKEVSSRPGREQTDDDLPSVSTQLAPEQHSTGATRREEEGSKEDPPNPPSGGFQATDFGFDRFQEAWHFPITDMPKAITTWSAFTLSEREDAITGARGYRAYVEGERRAGRNRAIKDAHRWLRDRLWVGYLPQGKAVEARAERFDAREGSEEWRAWSVFYRICGQSGIPDFLVKGATGERVADLPRRWPPVGRGIPADQPWLNAIEGTPQFAAWLARLRELPNAKIALRTVVIEGGRTTRAIAVPCEWPPRKTSTGPPSHGNTPGQEEALRRVFGHQ